MLKQTSPEENAQKREETEKNHDEGTGTEKTEAMANNDNLEIDDPWMVTE